MNQSINKSSVFKTTLQPFKIIFYIVGLGLMGKMDMVDNFIFSSFPDGWNYELTFEF